MSETLTARAWSEQLEQELKHNILEFWMEHAPAAEDEGFVGEIGADLSVREDADRSLVLNARILWTFAAAYRRYADNRYLDMASRAYRYLRAHFRDVEQGGYYWMLTSKGEASEDKKQVYGQAFVIYALSEYVLALDARQARSEGNHADRAGDAAENGRAENGDPALSSVAEAELRAELLMEARELFRLLETHSRDAHYEGYIEAHARDWSATDDLSLSGKDLNEKKSMNTHLHVLEGYTNLYRIWPSEELKSRLSTLLETMLDHIVDAETGHFLLFFDEAWTSKSAHVSYGHDIEGSWLLMEAAEVLGDGELEHRVRETALKMARAVLERGVDTDGGLWNEAEHGRLVDDGKDWWPQAEAMVGFYNAYRATGDEAYRTAAERSWNFIREYIVDREHGEWYWSVSNDRMPNVKDPKLGAWKCPYHNGRACLEMLGRIERA
ncbi:AGE family epimerase/isomerase [Saccharibacillus sp. CPCC 101409]|uniref:AGE family epimerase/isomerase n=1 Tax=Saccharibacillus sp. CPCC 101409 TaxID=3058041 RepID=UPI00267363E7|nr:AGE family epimerase/isomerase [Saccharibacillus sp. CPCC 101409]MDO3412570.1 AGE family epimerase/isomerase [Saccharibacillus sp. CPCC 101409]